MTGFALWRTMPTWAAATSATPVELPGSPEAIGKLLFSRYTFPFEVTSVLLLVALVGAVVMTRDTK
jgi:NADH-quinone oxidoreductase subunit J